MRLLRFQARLGPILRRLLIGMAALLIAPESAHAEGGDASAALSTRFDANTLWLPAGHTFFATISDTRPISTGQIAFGVAGEYLHRPLNLQVSSPDRNGREVRVLRDAVDSSYFLAFGLARGLELTLAMSQRNYQRGAGAGGVSSQRSDPLPRSALRRPRLGLGYSLDDAIGSSNFGLRLGVEAALPFSTSDDFAGERSLVLMPSATFALRFARLRLSSLLGARLRSALEFGGVRLGNQGYIGLAVGYELAAPGLLRASLEAFALPALSDSRAQTAPPSVVGARLLSAEWLGSVQSSLGSRAWTVLLAAGSGLPFSSESRASSAGTSERYFLGLGTPDFRSLLVLRYLSPALP